MTRSSALAVQRAAAPRSVSRPHEGDEREAERAADVVARGGSVAGWSFASVTASRSPTVHRQEVHKEKTEEEKKEEALEKTKEALLETPQAKALKDAVLADPAVKAVTDAVTSTPGLIATGAAIAGGVGGLAATGKELPFQPPEIPLDNVTPGLSAKVKYEGPVNAPTFVGLTLTYKEQGPKPKKTAESERIAADIARLKAQEQMFKPESQKAAERRQEQELVQAWIRSQGGLPGLPGLTIPLKGSATESEATKEGEEKEEERAPVQPAPASPSAELPLGAEVDDALATPGRPLEPGTRKIMEARFGYDFSGVRVHDDARAAATAAQIEAAAFTVESDVVFAAGRYDPAGEGGRRLIAHELAHVVQQGRGGAGANRVRKRPQPSAPPPPPQVAPLTDEELRAYLETIRRTRTIAGGAGGPRRAREVVSRFRAGAPDFSVLTIPDRGLLVRELLAGAPAAGSETAILDLFTEARPEERFSIVWDVGEDRVRAGLSEPNRRLFDDLIRTSLDRAIEALVTNWTVDEVVAILDRHGDLHVIDDLIARGYRIFRFDTAFDRWRYDDGRRDEVELTGLRGNTDRDARIIRIRASLTSEEAASTLFHESRHAVSPASTTEDERLEDEVSARVATEEFRIRHGMGPTDRSYRRPDGTVDEDEIRRQVRGSPHYNPSGRRRIGRRYVGDGRVGGWRPPRSGGAQPSPGGGGRP